MTATFTPPLHSLGRQKRQDLVGVRASTQRSDPAVFPLSPRQGYTLGERRKAMASREGKLVYDGREGGYVLHGCPLREGDPLDILAGTTWIADEDRLPAAKLFYSPYDLDASAGTKRSTHWIGYKVHFTETCDEDLPRLLTQVTTTIAPIPDRAALPDTHAVLEQRDL